MFELGETAPDFEAQSTQGTKSLYDWQQDSWVVLISYPKAHTSVCSAELVAVAKLLDKYSEANVKVAAISTDKLEDQVSFGEKMAKVYECPAEQVMQFSDSDLKIVNLYKMLHSKASDELAMRVTYVIDPEHKIRLVQAYPPIVERNFDELLEAIDKIRKRDEQG